MNKKILISMLLISLFTIKTTVFAESNTYAKEGESNYNSLQSSYKQGITTTTINGSGEVKLYGYSDCDNSGCTYSYMNQSSSVTVENILAQMVKCSNGEKYINYTDYGSAGDGFKTNNSSKYIGKVYWTESYYVTCTTDNTAVQLNNTNGNNNSNQTTTTTTTTTSVTNNTTNNDSEYNSSNTTDNPEQGVETYYLVLGITVIISYVFMLIVKKYNLFKKI